VLFGVLAPLARRLGHQASYLEYLTRRAATGVPLEPYHRLEGLQLMSRPLGKPT